MIASGDGAAAEMAIPGRGGWEQDPITTLLYTSGSSGRPKGAVYREHMLYGMLQVRIVCAKHRTTLPVMHAAAAKTSPEQCQGTVLDPQVPDRS